MKHPTKSDLRAWELVNLNPEPGHPFKVTTFRDGTKVLQATARDDDGDLLACFLARLPMEEHTLHSIWEYAVPGSTHQWTID